MSEKLRKLMKEYEEKFGGKIALYGLPDFRNEEEIIIFIQKCLEEGHPQLYYYPLKPHCQC